jgi:hypothetical protein
MIDDALNKVPALVPFGLTSPQNGSLGGDISAKCEAYLAYLSDPGNMGDVFVHNGVNYRIFRSSTSQTGGGQSQNYVLLVKEQ